MRSLLTSRIRSGAFSAAKRAGTHQEISSSASRAVSYSSHGRSAHIVHCKPEDLDVFPVGVSRRDLLVVRFPA